ncbi:unnamed protein product [Protopolystoma xenopodis]|uniref:Uncharacterized protein n=1 Tax=Protopolystoma xenopodis TaxID=117903 RepID=A0A3S5ASV3_9PLAT|nr:unnamed protein product [Protopolystoma xenopodis]
MTRSDGASTTQKQSAETSPSGGDSSAMHSPLV